MYYTIFSNETAERHNPRPTQPTKKQRKTATVLLTGEDCVFPPTIFIMSNFPVFYWWVDMLRCWSVGRLFYVVQPQNKKEIAAPNPVDEFNIPFTIEQSLINHLKCHDRGSTISNHPSSAIIHHHQQSSISNHPSATVDAMVGMPPY